MAARQVDTLYQSSSDENDLVILGIGAAAAILAVQIESEDEDEEPPAKMPRLCWSREWLKRGHLSYYYALMMELEQEDHSGFMSFLRVLPEVFHEICNDLTPRLERYGCNFRKPHPVGLKVAITLRYLATGM